MLIRRLPGLQASSLRPSSRLCQTCKQRAPAWAQFQQRRQFHPSIRVAERTVKLDDQNHLEKHGIPGLLSPNGFELGWTIYQGRLLEKLDETTAGTPFENYKPFDLLIETAREPTLAPYFNRASMAWNNHFFYSGILPRTPTPSDKISPRLLQLLEFDFGSLENLRETMLAQADAMFGPGFTWLVQSRVPGANAASHFRIMNTYLAGSPHAGAHWRKQSLDMNAESMNSLDGIVAPRNDVNAYPSAPMRAGKFGKWSEAASSKFSPGGADVTPVLCVNTWEHVYLQDWAFEKRGFLEAWWQRVNWNKVEELAVYNRQDEQQRWQLDRGQSFLELTGNAGAEASR